MCGRSSKVFFLRVFVFVISSLFLNSSEVRGMPQDEGECELYIDEQSATLILYF